MLDCKDASNLLMAPGLGLGIINVAQGIANYRLKPCLGIKPESYFVEECPTSKIIVQKPEVLIAKGILFVIGTIAANALFMKQVC